ncbi:hypothetical protein JM18_003629, partial [Phytophthora kernoviae]
MSTSCADDGERKRCAGSDSTMAPPSHPQDADISRNEISSSEDASSTQNNRVKWARLLLRELYDLGFNDAAAALEREAAVQLCSPAMKRFQTLVNAQEWDSALELVTQKDGDWKLQMKSIQATREAGLLLLQRKYIELLLKREVKGALKTFQEEILPVYNPSEKEVKQLAELLLCQGVEEMKERAQMPWQDEQLRARIEGLVSPEEIIPEGALRRLVQDGPEMNLQAPQPMLTGQVTGECMEVLEKHTGDVWELAFSPDGKILASASSDGSVVLWELEFDTDPLYSNLSTENANDGSVAYQWSGRRALDIVVHPHESKVFVLVSGYEIRAYDIAHKTDEVFFKAEQLVSCIEISPSGRFLLINFVKQDQIVCLEIATVSIIAKYRGIREQRYVLRPCFGGTHCELVVSGSEDGKVYLWHRDSGKLLSDLDGHSSVVNVVLSVGSIASGKRADFATIRLETCQPHTWERATTVENFSKLVRGDQRLNEHALGQLCLQSLRVFKQLPNSPVTWLYLMILGSLAAVYGCGFFISPASDGSGIPTMRGLFAGVFQNPGDTLSFRTLVGKSLGTVISSSSGLSVGRAGPFTHIMAMIGYLMGKIPLFRRVNFGQENYNFIRAAVACGMTASFGSPLGGVLFSIEVTAKYYEIKCLWESIICSSFCILVFHIITFLKSDVLFERTNFTGFDVDEELFAFVLLGVITGVSPLAFHVS